MQLKYLSILDKGEKLKLSDRMELAKLHDKMKELTEKNTFYKAMRMAHQSLEQGERPTKYFFNKIRTISDKSNISSLEINNKIVTDTGLIEQHVYEHFRNQFDSDSPFTPNLNLDQFLRTHNCKLPTISETNSNNISQPISDLQIKEAIHKLNKNSASGPDGYTPKLIKLLYKLIPHYFHVSVKKELGETNFEHT